MAWRYATFINSVAQAGKREYALPLYVNAQLPALMERPGEYPSGGPHPYYLAVYRATAPSIDFYSPDIYWPEFEYWVKRYQIGGNPIFISGSADRKRPLQRAVCLRGGESYRGLSVRHRQSAPPSESNRSLAGDDASLRGTRQLRGRSPIGAKRWAHPRSRSACQQPTRHADGRTWRISF